MKQMFTFSFFVCNRFNVILFTILVFIVYYDTV